MRKVNLPSFTVYKTRCGSGPGISSISKEEFPRLCGSSISLKECLIDMGKSFEMGSSSSNNEAGQQMFKNRLSALVVDDCKMHRVIHRTHLVSLGVDSREVENGKEAVDLIQSGAAFDLILMDMDMPIMNGPQATSMLRAMGVSSMIVGVSARSREREKQVFMEAGLNDYHEKPLNRAKLISLLRQIDNSR